MAGRTRALVPQQLRHLIPQGVHLETASERDVEAGNKYGREFREYARESYRQLARQRAPLRGQILQALRLAAVGPRSFERWQRVLPYKFSHQPLSCAGSISSQAGGRFNIGKLLGNNPPKPIDALYLAEDRQTACCEVYGQDQNTSSGLTPADLALQDSHSMSYVAVNVRLVSFIDLHQMERLQPFLDIIKGFTFTKKVEQQARALKVSPETVVTSLETLKMGLLSHHWRQHPILADVPSVGQVFGELVCDAGVEGIVFPSVRSGDDKSCLVIYPKCVRAESRVELADDSPPGTVRTIAATLLC